MRLARDLVQSNKNDNESCVLISIKQPSTVTALDTSGSCSTVTAITSSTAKMETTVQVTITGYGFAQSTSVTFDGGPGLRPAASNV